jgi:hypothetical protein
VRGEIKLRLQVHADIEAKNAKGETALFYALESEGMLKLLMADLKAKNNEGQPVLAVAQRRKMLEAVKLPGKDAEDDITGLQDVLGGDN